MLRTRWAAIGAAVAVTLGAGGIGFVSATSPSDAVTFVPIEPCRLFDTRPDFQVGPRSSPLGPNETFTVVAHGDNGQCSGIPATATGLGLNVTAVGPTQATVLTIWGAGDRPNASSLNPTPGQPPTPNAVTSGLTGAGALNVWNAFGSVHVLADIVGYYTDHNHDDRYYTEAEVDSALGAKANASDVYTKAEVYTRAESDARRPHLILPDPVINDFFVFDFLPEITLSSSVDQTVSTTTAGRLQLQVYARAQITCSASDDHIVFLVVDGTTVASSAYLRRDDTGTFELVLSGITADAVPAGDHLVEVGVECSGASTASLNSTTLYAISSAVLYPT